MRQSESKCSGHRGDHFCGIRKGSEEQPVQALKQDVIGELFFDAGQGCGDPGRMSDL